MHSHFNHRHPYNHLIVIEEGCLPRCPKCLLHTNNIAHHSLTKCCNLGTVRKEYQQLEHKRPAILATTFTVNGTTIETVPAFKYLGRWLWYDNDDLLAVLQNIEEARKCWFQMKKLLARQNASPIAMGRFYLVAVQSILLYGSELWMLTDQQLCLLNSFHHQCACHITHMHIRPLPDGTWVTPASTDVLQAAGLKPISTYIQKCQEHVTEFAKNLSIYAQCDASKPTKSTSSHMYWWLLPNDVLNPLATPLITNMPHSNNHHQTCPPHLTFYHYHYHNTP